MNLYLGLKRVITVKINIIMSVKQKGNRLEYQVRDRFRSYVDSDCKRQLMSGADEWNKGDIRFSKKLPYNLIIECKNQERTSIWKWWAQAKEQASQFETPLLVFSRNHHDTLVTLKFDDFMKIYEELYQFLQETEKEEEQPITNFKKYNNIQALSKLEMVEKLLKQAKKLIK